VPGQPDNISAKSTETNTNVNLFNFYSHFFISLPLDDPLSDTTLFCSLITANCIN